MHIRAKISNRWRPKIVLGTCLITEVPKSHQVLGFTEPIQPTSAKSQRPEVSVYHIDKILGFRQPAKKIFELRQRMTSSSCFFCFNRTILSLNMHERTLKSQSNHQKATNFVNFAQNWIEFPRPTCLFVNFLKCILQGDTKNRNFGKPNIKTPPEKKFYWQLSSH